MKTTIDISDPLFNEVRELAVREGETFRSLVEQGLRLVVEERRAHYRVFKLRDASAGHGGMTPEFENATPEQWREAMYGDRG